MGVNRNINLIFAIVILIEYVVIAVDKSKFKNCEQSTFCKRGRNYKPGLNDYELLLESLLVNDSELKGTLYSHKSKTKLDLRLVSLVDSTFRLIVDEQSPIKQRYVVREALVSEPVREPMHVVRKTDEFVEIAVRSSRNSVQLFRRPFLIKFLQNNVEVVTANGLNLMNFEYLRSKPENVQTENKPEAEKDESEEKDTDTGSTDDSHDNGNDEMPGMWEESFSSFVDRKPYGPESVSLDFSFPKATHFYGVPEHADSLSLKSTVNADNSDPYRLYNLDVFEYELDSRMALYGAVPVVYALGKESCTGVYWQNAAETWVDVRKPSKGSWPISETISTLFSSSNNDSKSEHNVHFISEAGIIDAFVMLGPKPKDTFEQYARLTGVAPLPPISTIAYHQCRWNYNDQEDVGNVSMNFDQYKLPMDYMWLDIEYTDQKKYFTWDTVLFSNPLKMIANLEKVGRKLIIIIDPHIKADPGYFVNSDALANSLYVLDENKNVYDGHCWPGNSRYLDFWRPQTNDYYSNLYLLENFKTTTQNVFIWNDMNEPSVFSGPEITMPKTNLHFDGQRYFEHREVHNLYGLKNVAATFHGLVKRSNFTRRPFILTRSHFAGSQRYAAVWTGDNAADWAHLRISIPMCLSLAISGISFCGADVGGFFGNPSDELLTRWYQSGAWLPFFRAHAHIETARREPYLKSKDSLDVIRSALQQRYSYLPFWYLCFRNHEFNKTPVILPLFAEFPDDVTTFDIEDQFLVGGQMLVKPITKESTFSTSVYFPGGQSEIWYDIYTGNTYSGIGYFDISAPINKVPVFQRGGSIVPKKERVRRSSSAMKHDPYTLVVAVSKNSSAYGRIYVDDGETYNYKKGEYIDQKLMFENNRLTAINSNPAAFYDSIEFVERIRIFNGPKNILNAKVSVLNRDGTETSKILDVQYANSDRELIVCCRQPILKLGFHWTVELI